jgi:hypothetical protein
MPPFGRHPALFLFYRRYPLFDFRFLAFKRVCDLYLEPCTLQLFSEFVKILAGALNNVHVDAVGEPEIA